MIGGDPYPGDPPPRQVGHHLAPRSGAQVVNGRAVAHCRRDCVKIDAVDQGGRRGAWRCRHGPGHDTRDEVSSSWSSLPGM